MPPSTTSPQGNGSLTHPLNGAGRETAADLCRLATDLARGLPGEVRLLTVRSGDREIRIEWSSAATTVERDQEVDRSLSAPAGARAGVAVPIGTDPTGATGAAERAGTVAVRAPLVGTYFAAPSPDADPFVRVGDEVEPGATVAIIEAMKMMNPITATQGGVVTEILVSNAEPVEYDQMLVLITPFGAATGAATSDTATSAGTAAGERR